jgi:vancomycin permeability regulator SanA
VTASRPAVDAVVTHDIGGAPRAQRRWLRRGAWVLAGVLLLCAAMHTHVVLTASPHTFAPADAPTADCIVVPGARIHADGTPFDLLTDRLDTARHLFALGKAKCIVLSGRGGGGLDEDEVASMRRWLLARGVPAAAMVDDALGLRTLDTMRRCRELGMRSAIVVTNPFHIARSVFLARAVGLDASGVEAPYAHDYSLGTMAKNRGREVIARVWAWLDVFAFGAAG